MPKGKGGGAAKGGGAGKGGGAAKGGGGKTSKGGKGGGRYVMIYLCATLLESSCTLQDDLISKGHSSPPPSLSNKPQGQVVQKQLSRPVVRGRSQVVQQSR